MDDEMSTIPTQSKSAALLTVLPEPLMTTYDAAMRRSILERARRGLPHVGHGNSLSGPLPFCGMLRDPFTR